MKLGWFAILVVACTKPAAPPAPPVPPPAPPPPVTQAPSCDDVGPLLRGEVDDEATSGKAKEAVIIQACKDGAWSRATLACIAREPEPEDCLDRLTDDQQDGYEERIARWEDAHPGGDDDDEDDELDPADAHHACEDVISSVETWAPPVTVTGDDKDVAVALRKAALVERCDADEWSEEAKVCLEARVQPTPTCVAMLEADQRQAISKRLAELDKVVAKAATLRKQAATHTCKKVVAAHYSDARWKPELPHVKGAERKKLIVDSRTRMREACTKESWTASVRACVVAGGGERCFDVTSPRARRWGFPASGIVTKPGIPECDAYVDAVMKLSTCASLPQESRDALLEAISQTSSAWSNVPPEGRAALATACTAARDAVQQSAAACP